MAAMTDLDEIRDALTQPNVRLQFGVTVNLSTGRLVDTVQIYTKTPKGRWTKVGPLVLPREDVEDQRVSLLEDLVRIVRGEVAR